MKGAVDERFQGPLQQQNTLPVAGTAATFGCSNLFQRLGANASSFANIAVAETKENEEEIAMRQEEEVKAFRERYDLDPWADEQDGDADGDGMVWNAFAGLERFNNEEVDVFAATRSKGKRHQQSVAAKAGEKVTEKAKGLEEMAKELRELRERERENVKDLPKILPTFERAYTNESRIADPQTAENLVNRMLDVVIPNVTARDILSLSGDARKAMVERLRITKSSHRPESQNKCSGPSRSLLPGKPGRAELQVLHATP
jgi:hypothetical protein